MPRVSKSSVDETDLNSLEPLDDEARKLVRQLEEMNKMNKQLTQCCSNNTRSKTVLDTDSSKQPINLRDTFSLKEGMGESR